MPDTQGTHELAGIAALLAAGGDQEKETVAKRLVRLAAGAELWHTPDDEPYASVMVDGHREHIPIESRAFRRWLARRYYEANEKPPGGQALQDALQVLTGKAMFEGQEHPVYTRVAGHGGNVYLDLADEEWRAVEVTPAGWRVVRDPPVRFRRARGMRPLPEPVPGGGIEELREFVNVGSEDDWRLLVSWLVGALRPSGPYPVLIFQGEQGSAKSTAAKVARALIDPNTAALRTYPRDERDLMIAAKNGWVVAYDNLSGLADWLSDAICRVATGGGFGTRMLYENTDEVLIDAQRPVILNGIDEIARRGDLRDRAVTLYLPRIPDEGRRDERTFWVRFEEARPRILGALLDAVGVALRRQDAVRLERLPRMADFAIWVTAAEPALPWPEGAFLEAYTHNRAAQDQQAIEYDALAQAVVALMHDTPAWEGTATALLRRLDELVDERARRSKGWPQAPNALTNRLRRVAPSLRAVGIEIEWPQRSAASRKITINRTGMQETVTTVTTVTGRSGSGFQDDDHSAGIVTGSSRGPSHPHPDDDHDDRHDGPGKRPSLPKPASQAAYDDHDDDDDGLPNRSSRGGDFEEGWL